MALFLVEGLNQTTRLPLLSHPPHLLLGLLTWAPLVSYYYGYVIIFVLSCSATEYILRAVEQRDNGKGKGKEKAPAQQDARRRAVLQGFYAEVVGSG
ncbi:hypothetical protein K435DRAFT_860169 [Dendrothele bispora CBS 962.96]|uniref:Uncharacterized protein n=1 Tax=Dendrothele bispora (strain CBS 962.96) TaxID=1314807 RepID=A0A4S8LZQ7_DENBC|nr:hypothetical protein K435DRAFT_860169 [Dendrothele bispora CBS 962.96]